MMRDDLPDGSPRFTAFVSDPDYGVPVSSAESKVPLFKTVRFESFAKPCGCAS